MSVMLIDTDEYLVFQNVSQYDTVTDFLQEYVPKGALQISWITFGTANETKYRPEPVLKRFRYKVAGQDSGDGFTKTVAVLDHIDDVKNPHYVVCKPGYSRITMDGNAIGKTAIIPRSRRKHKTDVVALYHYRYKSIEENHVRRCVRGDIYKFTKAGEMLICGWDTAPCNAYDDSAWQTLKKNVPKYRIYDNDDDGGGGQSSLSSSVAD